MKSSLIYGADARPRKPCCRKADCLSNPAASIARMACLTAPAINLRHAASPRLAPHGHERASWRHTKRHESSVPLILSDFRLDLHSNAHSNFNSHSNLYTCAATPQFVKGRTSNVRSVRVGSCAAKAAFRVRQATEPEGCFCETVWAEAKPQGPMATSGSRSP